MRPLVGQSRRTSPVLALAVAVGAVSTSAILVRWSAAPSLVKAFYRVAFTVLLLAPWVVTRHRQGLGRLDRRDLVVAAAAGVALAVHFATWFESLRFTSVAASVTLVQAQPLFVAVGAWAVLGEHVTRRTLAGIAIALAGVVVMTLPGAGLAGVADVGTRPLYGDGLALVGALTAGVYVLVGRTLRQRVALLPYVTVVYVACAVVLLVLSVARGLPLRSYPPREWLLFLAMAVGPGLLGHTVVNWALAHVESAVVSVTLLGEPVGSTLLAVVVLNEVPGPVTVVGGVVVLAGIAVAVRARGAG